MAEPSGFTRDDLRAAVASGILAEDQAARLLALAETRLGQRALQSADDEPFELFRGFAEIFVSVGLVLLITGLVGLARIVLVPAIVLVFAALLSVGLAVYFTRRRRMVLPSIVLVTGYAVSVLMLALLLTRRLPEATTDTATTLVVGGVTGLALVLWYRAFRVPFTMFLLGLTGLGVVFMVTQGIDSMSGWAGPTQVFDLRNGSALAVGTLLFGVVAFVAAMAFDVSDPHRLGRRAAAGFWMHLLAAPALVNTVALTFYNMQNATGYALLLVSLAIITVLALVIDRRSFLTAGLGYFGALLYLVLRGIQDFAALGVILILGVFVTVLGAFWTQTRGTLMRMLPEFPGKRRLPPYMN